jgi:ATP-dependent DNA helicase RecQ
VTRSENVGAASLPRKILSDVFGIDDFRSSQAAVVAALMAGRNVLAVMPANPFVIRFRPLRAAD